MTDTDTSLEDKIALEVARQIEPLLTILRKLEGEAGLSSRPSPEPAAPDPADLSELVRQKQDFTRASLKVKEAAVRSRIAEIEGNIAARLTPSRPKSQPKPTSRPEPKSQPKPKGDSHV